MAKVKVVNKKIKMDKSEIIRFQLNVHCYLNNISLSDFDLECLVELGFIGKVELTSFCEKTALKKTEENIKKGIKAETSPQTVRNALMRAEKENLLIKEGKWRKTVYINPEINVLTEGNILLDYKAFYIEPQEV